MGRKLKMSFQELCEKLLMLCDELDGVPTYYEVKDCLYLPSYSYVNRIFEKNGYENFQQFCQQNGYKLKDKKKSENDFSYEDICQMFELFYEKHGRYPLGKEMTPSNNLPSKSTMYRVVGEGLDQFKEKYGRDEWRKKYSGDFYFYASKIIDLHNDLGRTPRWNEVFGKLKVIEFDSDFPGEKWFYENCPDKNVKNYSDLLDFLNLDQKKKT